MAKIPVGPNRFPDYAEAGGVDRFRRQIRDAESHYPAFWRDDKARAFQRYKADEAMNHDGPDWHGWHPETLRNYIAGVRSNPADAYGWYCQWMGCEERRMDENHHFCATHEMVAEANK